LFEVFADPDWGNGSPGAEIARGGWNVNVKDPGHQQKRSRIQRRGSSERLSKAGVKLNVTRRDLLEQVKSITDCL